MDQQVVISFFDCIHFFLCHSLKFPLGKNKRQHMTRKKSIKFILIIKSGFKFTKF